MLAKKPKRVRLEKAPDLHELVEDVERDGAPRVIERAGKGVAVVVSAEEYKSLSGKPLSAKKRKRLMGLAGAWKDVDADAMIEHIYKARHESPPSKPVKL
jgi:prevent-host-death family protein